MTDEVAPTRVRYRVGRKAKRTVYRQGGPEPSDDDTLIGMFDTAEQARFAVVAMNRLLAFGADPGGLLDKEAPAP